MAHRAGVGTGTPEVLGCAGLVFNSNDPGVSMQTQFVFSSARTAVALAIGAGALFAAATAHAQVVSSGIVNLTIPASLNGLYLNVVNGANNLPPPGADGVTVPGWDINPWSATGIAFFSPTAPAGGAYVLSGANTVANLAPGSFVSAASTYGSASSANTAQWNLNSSNNFFGFRFLNEAGGTTHYGWAQIAFGASLTDRTLVQYAFELTPGASIAVVPEPSTYAMMGLGVLGLMAAARRRKAKQA
jgi:hypothetical protein